MKPIIDNVNRQSQDTSQILRRCGLMLIIIAIFVSCKRDLLNTVPKGEVASSSMWTTDNLTNLGMSGVYGALRLGQSTGGMSGREIYQYDRFGPMGQTRNGEALLVGTATSSNSLFLNVWKELYEGIHRANDAIKNISEVSPSAPAKKARYVAESKFLRAYFYSRLNQVFKGVPIYLEPVKDVTEFTKPRSSESEVWQQVINDLTDAINEPELPLKYAKGDGNYGHATKGAAYALRGKTYMYLKEWQKAADDFAEVKKAGYSLYTGAGADSYEQLFKEPNEQSDEMIFSIQNMSLVDYGSTTQKFCGTRSAFGSNWNNLLINPSLVDLYDNKDGSKFNWNDHIAGYSSMPVKQREVYFLRDNITAAERKALTDKGVDLTDYKSTGNEARILAAYNNRDPRLEANVITPYSVFQGTSAVTMRWPYRGSGDLRSDAGGRFYYLHRKFVYEGDGTSIDQIVNRQYGPTDLPLIRYADVLLMWAEALNEISFNTTSIDLVNQVRARAGVGLLNSSPATLVSSQADLRERIRDERRVEFINEGINYFDELRWGTWIEEVFTPGNGIQQIWGLVDVPYILQGNYITTWPIPAGEIEMNGALTPTEGWLQ